MSDDVIYRREAIDALNDGTELLRRVLDDADIVGVERAKYEWGLGLIESFISDMEELPSAEPEIVRCKDCKYYNPIGACIEMSSAVCEDSFCCWAERRTDAEIH